MPLPSAGPYSYPPSAQSCIHKQGSQPADGRSTSVLVAAPGLAWLALKQPSLARSKSGPGVSEWGLPRAPGTHPAP